LESKVENTTMNQRVRGLEVVFPPGYSFEKGISPQKGIDDKK